MGMGSAPPLAAGCGTYSAVFARTDCRRVSASSPAERVRAVFGDAVSVFLWDGADDLTSGASRSQFNPCGASTKHITWSITVALLPSVREGMVVPPLRPRPSVA